MRRATLTLIAAVAAMSGCYHVTVLTGAPQSSTVITEPWQMSFVSGLVPPEEIDATQVGCSSGVARVETWHSFLNVLVAGLSSSLVTPISVTVTCASSAPAPDAAAPGGNDEDPAPAAPEGAGASDGEPGTGGVEGV